jgi:hypothetical protein
MREGKSDDMDELIFSFPPRERRALFVPLGYRVRSRLGDAKQCL